ncbi:hypothetical protein [Actinoplanes sp. NPDC026623]|uniref:hypothetical protein n=1 Tax=Actinoplanes sp. NPDC026623 TaxID=3155610 RepID=UPI0033D18C53
MGLFIIVLMVIGTVLLIRNMNKHLRRLPDSFADPNADRRAAEITRLNADLELPDATPGEVGSGPAASDVENVPAEAEVKGAESGDSPRVTGGRGESA